MSGADRTVTWLGQAGFRLELDGVAAVIDPWVSEHEGRLIPAPPLELAADGVDCVLITHEHLDHLDLPFLPRLLERSPGATVVLPSTLLPLVGPVVPPTQLVGVQPGESLEVAGLDVHVVPAFHGLTMEDAYGDGSAHGGGARFVGYVVGRVYHAGDTIVTTELEAALGELDVEVALLPINGRDDEREARGIVGNMDAREAVELAVAVGATTLVPYHWDGFAGNTVAPGTAADAAEGRIHVVVPARFERVRL
jgi:L-ascorbate metabolism protein UlaG (beta-lactamase superfamily)